MIKKIVTIEFGVITLCGKFLSLGVVEGEMDGIYIARDHVCNQLRVPHFKLGKYIFSHN